MPIVRIDLEVDASGATKISQTAGALKDVGAQGKAAKEAVQSIFTGIGQGIGQDLFAALKGIPGAFVSAAAAAIDYGGKLVDLNGRTAVSIEAIQQLDHVAKMNGLTFENDVAPAIAKMQKALTETPEKFDRLGMSVTALRAMKPEDQFVAIAERIGSIADPAQRATAAMEIFGKSGATLLPMMNDQLRATMEEAEKLGLVMSSSVARSADDLGDSLDTLRAVFVGLLNNFGAAIVTSEPLHQLIHGLIDVFGGLSKEVGDNQAGFRSFVDQGVVFVANALVPLTEGVELAASIFKGLADVWTGVVFSGKVLADTLVLIWEATSDPRNAKKAWEDYKKLIDDSLNTANEDLQKHEQALQGVMGVTGKVKDAAQHLADVVANSVGVTHEATAAEVAHGAALGESAKQAAEAARIQKIVEDTAGKMRVDAVKAVNKDLEDEYHKNAKVIQAILDKQVKDDQERAAIEKTGIESRIHLLDMEAQKYGDIANAAKTLASVLSGELGSALAGIGNAFAGLSAHTKQAEQNFKDYGDESMTTGQKLQGGAQAAAGAIAIWQSQQYNRSGASGAAHGAEQGAAAGAQFGPVGMVVGAVAGGILGFFAGGKFRQACEDAGKVLGGRVSDELGKAIMKTAKDDKISTSSASLLHISDFMAESGKSASSMGAQIKSLFDGIASGTIPAKEGMEELNKDFDALATAAAGGDLVAQKLTGDLIQQALATGKLTDSMKQFVTDAMSGMASGADQILKGLADINKDVPLGDFGVAAAQMFVGGFTAEIAQKGLVQAIEDDGKGIEDLYQRLNDEGNTAAAGMLAPWVQLSAVINDDADPSVRGFLETLQGMSQVFAGIDKLGFVTGDSFQALETGAEGAFNALTEGGVASKTALQAISPQLAQIIQAHDKYGIAIDAGTQKLIDEAKQAGISFPTDPVTLMVDAVHDLIDAINIMNHLPVRNWGSGPPDAPPPDDPGSPEAPPMAMGGYVGPSPGGSLRRLAEAGQGEYVVPAGQMAAMQGSNDAIHALGAEIRNALKSMPKQIAAGLVLARG